LFNPNPNLNPRNLRKENPNLNPNPRNPKKELKSFMKPQEDIDEMADGLSQIVIEKLNKNNFQVWKFKIMNFLMGKGYWEFITGDEK